MMKKILCAFLAFACLFGLLSCGAGSDTKKALTIYDIAAKGKTPTKIVTFVDYANSAKEISLHGEYRTEIQGENSIFTFEYQRLASIEEMADSRYVTERGVIYYRDGQVSVDGSDWEARPTEMIAPDYDKFDLKASLLEDVHIYQSGKDLQATVPNENIGAVIGTDLGIEGDVELEVISDGANITEIIISYETAQGASVNIHTTYSYNVLVLDFENR